jgi:hypothetical protein
MAEVQISRQDIASLVEKLSRLELELTPPERTLLLFMLGVAVEAIDRSETGEAASTLVSAAKSQSVPVVVAVPESVPSIKDEFAVAFTPRETGGVRLLEASVGRGP